MKHPQELLLFGLAMLFLVVLYVGLEI